ncbi:hypothetical protein DV495_003002 [Geotrichum candidum]|uniref:Major facilitator superfamily (MFS) profile domain-containing protein n=1 Tax=Geotrichum candidum TaxID=1173061 RepID=A0A0J9YHK6_GEOCN|nr:hypothetical protein DV454_003235 [Geotrichum candidum]KAI9212486.1 hypothetical protein DS838_002635 [Geotrichum bryndzae]KAF5116252.1 hypothetical protein DV452_002719 [Geotrichum candidum]KAF5127020.1 hypothetical protein DV495_003002 [Geotrichum candidum]KAF7499677.1 hypothetical protein DV113_002263 [Geotrichum candidum]
MEDKKEQVTFVEDISDTVLTESVNNTKQEVLTTSDGRSIVCPETGRYLSATELYPHIDEKKLLRKMDIRIVPTLALLYLMSFLDRGNIGNANIEGLSKDLGLTSQQYNMCLTVFFFTYCAFEVPSNWVMKKYLSPSTWLPTIMVAWGASMIGMGFVKNYAGLLVTRILLGATEAGLFPGVAYFLTQWYCNQELQFRQALFFSAASVAGAFSGLLAFGIAKMDGVGGLEGWRWIFILEGILTVLVACLAYYWLYDYPSTAKFLTAEEKAFVQHRLIYDSHVKGASVGGVQFVENTEVDRKYVKAAFLDWQLVFHIINFWGIGVPLYGISLFLPTILRGLGYSVNKSQLMTIPIYITASVLSVIQAWVSDRLGKRAPFIVLGFVLILIGMLMAICSNPATHPMVVYGGVYITCAGIYPAFPGVIAWNANNQSGSYKRAIAMAIHIGVGNMSGAIAANIYRGKDAPRFILGHSVVIGFVCCGIISSGLLMMFYKMANKRRDAELNSGKYDNDSIDELIKLGDKSPYFRYRF